MWRAVAVFSLVILAGCGSSVHFDETGSPIRTPDGRDGSTIRTTSPMTTSPVPSNPWRKQMVVVGIENVASPDRNITPLVRSTLQYWERRKGDYGAYEVDFVLDADASSPDIRVRFVESVECRSIHDDSLGCAPLLDASSRISDAVTVEIESGYTDASTRRILDHEFGHVLGIRHGSPPESVMSASYRAVHLPSPNATERSHPWKTTNLTVYVAYNTEETRLRRERREQIDHALAYYAHGADGYVSEPVTFAYTTNRTAADVLVYFTDDDACVTDDGSCGASQGPDPDADGAIEYYNRYRITLVDLDGNVSGWHVGYWIGRALGAESTDELPPPFRDADPDERRNWWRER